MALGRVRLRGELARQLREGDIRRVGGHERAVGRVTDHALPAEAGGEALDVLEREPVPVGE